MELEHSARLAEFTHAETEVVDLSLLFEIAAFAQDHWRRRENKWWEDTAPFEHRQLWGIDNSPRERYDNAYAAVYPRERDALGNTLPSPQKIEAQIESLVAQKGQVVFILYGANYNPFQDIMERVNVLGQEKKLLLISVGLQDKRRKDQKEANEAAGWYHVGGSIGVPTTFTAIHAQLEELVQRGIIRQPFADIQMTGLLGGWRTIPLRETFLLRFKYDNTYRDEFSDREWDKLLELEFRWARIPPAERIHMQAAYIKHIAQSILGLANPTGYRIYAEMTKTLRDILDSLFSRKPLEDLPIDYHGYIDGLEVAADFRGSEESSEVVGHFAVSYPIET